MSDQTQDNASEAVAGSSEPSMEDILASIRRIIAEDDDATILEEDAAPVQAQAEEIAEPEDDLLVLDEMLKTEDDAFTLDDLAIPDVENVSEVVQVLDDSVDLDLAVSEDIAVSEETVSDLDVSISEAVEDIALDQDLDIAIELETAAEDDNVIDLLDIPVVEEPAEPAEELSAFDALDLTLEETLSFDAQDTDLDFDTLLDELELDDLASDDAVDLSAQQETHTEVLTPEELSSEKEISDQLLADLMAPETEADGSPDIDAMLDEPLDLAIEDFQITDDALDLSESDIVRAEPEIASESEPDLEPVTLDEPETPMSPSDDADIDLVKSLMADLTDTSFMDSDDIGPDVDMTLDEAAHFVEATDEAADEQDAVLDDILNLAMDDEIATTQIIDDPDGGLDDIARAIAEPQADSGPNILLDIAAAAEADAEWVQVKMKEVEADSEDVDADELAIPEVEEPSTDDIIDELMDFGDDTEVEEPTAEIMAEVEDSLAQTEETFDPVEIKEEVADMPKAAASDDTILDEITETAASDAFAELSQVVEEKTSAKAAGPHIGDLVQEALKPMLKEWLDENLKDIVERAVTKEVKRISSRK